MDIGQSILVYESKDGGQTLGSSNGWLSSFKVFRWFSEILEIFVNLELSSGQSICVWLKLWRKLLQLRDNSGVSVQRDASLEGLFSVLNCRNYILILSHFLKSFIYNFLFDQFASKLKIFFAGKDSELIYLILGNGSL